MSNDFRNQQINDVRSQRRLGLPSKSSSHGSAGGKHVPKGHDALLKRLQDEGCTVVVTLMNRELSVEGKIVGRDKFTITVRHADGKQEECIYKHAIESFARKVA